MQNTELEDVPGFTPIFCLITLILIGVLKSAWLPHY